MRVMRDADTGPQCILAIGKYGALEIGDDVISQFESDLAQCGFDHLQGQFLDIVANLQALLIFDLGVVNARQTGQ